MESQVSPKIKPVISSTAVAVNNSGNKPAQGQTNSSVDGNNTRPQAANFQLRPQLISTFGLRLTGNNTAVAVQMPNSSAQPNIQMGRGGTVPVASLGAGGQLAFRPTRIANTAFPSAIVGQPLALQRLPSKGPVTIQHLPSGTVVPVSSQQVVTLQRPSSPAKVIPLRQLYTQPLGSGQQRLVGPVSSTGQRTPATTAATIIAVSQAQQLTIRVPQPSVQRVLPSVLGSVQVTLTGQQNFIQCLPSSNAAAQSSNPAGGSIRAQATIVGSQAILPGHQISLQPRPATAIVSSVSNISSTIVTSTVIPSVVSSTKSSQIIVPNPVILHNASQKSLAVSHPVKKVIPTPKLSANPTSHIEKSNIAVVTKPSEVSSQSLPLQLPLVTTSAPQTESHVTSTQVSTTTTTASPACTIAVTSSTSSSNVTAKVIPTLSSSSKSNSQTVTSCDAVQYEVQIVNTAVPSPATLTTHVTSVSSYSVISTATVTASEKIEPSEKLKPQKPGRIESVTILTTEQETGTTVKDTEPTVAESRSQKMECNDDGNILTEGFIDSNLLEWDGGIGTLPGTNMKFKINEFGDLELIDEGLEAIPETATTERAKTPQENISNSTEESKRDKSLGDEDDDDGDKLPVTDPADLSDHEGDLCCCVYCGRYGYRSNFRNSGKFCSQTCSNKKNDQRKQMMVSRLVYKDLKTSPVDVEYNEHHGLDSAMEKKTSAGFDWDNYLAETGSIGAPRRLFKEPFPTTRNGFRIGMRLEGVDPKHQSLFCVLSVAEIQGFRLRLHFDGYSECYDFWVNCDSPLIFPVGWAEKNGKGLQPPKTIAADKFNWTNYLKESIAVAAPKSLFSSTTSTVTPSAFRVGMKLEAVDKKNHSLIGVATVADTIGDKVLIHFDGWEDSYDYWCDITSPSIHPVGWCESNGHTLTSPPDFEDNGTFSWDAYLSETKATAVPVRAFKPRPSIGFERGMKVELVDKRNPVLVRVATIADIQESRLLMHFDGWDSIYDYWIDEDCHDLHPPHWCHKTGHSLQPPIDKEELQKQSDCAGCPTLGCNGIGHIKGAKYTGHHSAFGCPYSETNMSKETTLTDRLGSSRSEEGGAPLIRHDSYGEVKKCPTVGCDGMGHVTGKFTSHHCLSGCPLAEKNQAKVKQESQDTKHAVRPGRGRKRKIFSTSNSPPKIKMEPVEERAEVQALRASIHESVFQNNLPPLPYVDSVERGLCWNQHTRLLPGVMGLAANNVSQWTVAQVAQFVQALTGQEDQASKFLEQEVDGDSFLLLQQSDLLNFMNIKLGPAVKIFNSILAVRATSQDY